MKKSIGLLLVLLALIGILYLVAPYVRVPANLFSSPQSAGSSGVQMTVAQLYADSDSYTVHAEYPQFDISNVDTILKGRVEKAVADFETFPANPPDSGTPQNQFIGTFDAVYVGPDIVSVELIFSEDTGGAHPNTLIDSVNIERVSGRELTLDDALALIGRNLQQVSEEAAAQLQAKLGDDFAFPDGAAPTSDNYSVFLVASSTVTFVFNDYQVAPYADGPQEVSFPRVR